MGVVHHSLYKEYEDRYYYKYVCASFRNPPRPQVAKTQMIKVIVLLVLLITIYSCTGMEFVCNDLFDNTLSLSEKADILKQCSKGQLMWKKEF